MEEEKSMSMDCPSKQYTQSDGILIVDHGSRREQSNSMLSKLQHAFAFMAFSSAFLCFHVFFFFFFFMMMMSLCACFWVVFLFPCQ
jgi:hypothetical protein